MNTSGSQGIPTISVYGAARAGVEVRTHALALEVASKGIIINGVAPGLGHTSLTVNNVDEFMAGNRQRSALRDCAPRKMWPRWWRSWRRMYSVIWSGNGYGSSRAKPQLSTGTLVTQCSNLVENSNVRELGSRTFLSYLIFA